MLRVRLRTILIALVALVAIGSAVSTIPNVKLGFYSHKDCSVGSTTLLVDFGTGSTPESELSCAAGYHGTGWDLFKAVGFRVEGTSNYPTGFVCRIEDVPAASSEPCLETPAASAGHWAYFYATAADPHTWHFSPIGAGMRKPNCGDWDGWRYLLPGEDPLSNQPRQVPNAYRCN